VVDRALHLANEVSPEQNRRHISTLNVGEMQQTKHEPINVVIDLGTVDVVNFGSRQERFHHSSAANRTGWTGKAGLIGIAVTIG
jgi:hypothetical protein